MAEIILKTLEPITPILSILITTLVSIIAIRKTAEANRLSNVHNEMLQCIIDSIVNIRKISILLDDIYRKASYFRMPEQEFIETAFDRYWREIQNISKDFNITQSKQKFVLPKKLYEEMQKIIDRLNEAREEAKNLKPNNNNVYSDTARLGKILKSVDLLYIDFIHETRVYLGVDALKPFPIRKEYILGIEETKENES